MNTCTLTQRHVQSGATISMQSQQCAACNGSALVNGALFPNEISGFNPKPSFIPRETEFRVIVSGYTPAVLSIVDVMAARAGAYGTTSVVHFLHYDKETGSYTCQSVAFGG